MTNKQLDGSRPKTLEDLELSFCKLECKLCSGGCSLCNNCYCNYCMMDDFVKYLSDKVSINKRIK